MDSACRARLPDTTAFPFSVFCTHVEFVFIPMPDSVWLPGINEKIWRFGERFYSSRQEFIETHIFSL